MNKISLDTMKYLSIDQIVQLFNQGYRIEDSKIVNLQENLPQSLSFNVTCLSNPCNDAHIIINNIDQGITDSGGKFTIGGLSLGSTINFTVTKLGFKDRTGSIIAGEVTDVSIDLIPETDTTSLRFVVTEPGTNYQVPSYGSRIILDNTDVGTTDKFGILLVPDLGVSTTIPFLVNKAGFPESFGIAKVGTKDGPILDIHVDLELFPIRTMTILRNVIIGTTFITIIGFIGGYVIKNIGNKRVKA